MKLTEAKFIINGHKHVIDGKLQVGYIKDLIIMPSDKIIPNYHLISKSDYEEILENYHDFRVVVEVDISEKLDSFTKTLISLEDALAYLNRR